jgi:methyl-accepting chemotaxis protein
MKFYKNLPIFKKILLIFTINFLLFLGFVLFYLLPQYPKTMMIEKKQALQYSVEMIDNMLKEFERRVSTGEFTLEEAQKRAKKQISALRYQNETNYFYVINQTPTMILHPIKTKLNGQNLSDFKDPNGKYLFNEMAEVCRKDGQGFVSYQWAKPGEEIPVDKISFVRLFRPWGWIVGTGVWVELEGERKAELDQIYLITGIILLIISIIIFSIGIIFSKSISNQINKLVNITKAIHKGDFSSVSKYF